MQPKQAQLAAARDPPLDGPAAGAHGPDEARSGDALARPAGPRAPAGRRPRRWAPAPPPPAGRGPPGAPPSPGTKRGAQRRLPRVPPSAVTWTTCTSPPWGRISRCDCTGRGRRCASAAVAAAYSATGRARTSRQSARRRTTAARLYSWTATPESLTRPGGHPIIAFGYRTRVRRTTGAARPRGDGVAMEPLSDRQRQMLTFISGYIAEHDRPPTNREIGQAMGIGSTGHVDYHLSVLAKKGFIEREANTSRGLRLTAASEPHPRRRVYHVPVVGRIAAGAPIEAITDSERRRRAGGRLRRRRRLRPARAGHVHDRGPDRGRRPGGGAAGGDGGQRGRRGGPAQAARPASTARPP